MLIYGSAVCNAAELCEAFLAGHGVAPVLTDKDGNMPGADEQVAAVSMAKAVLRGGRLTFLCSRDDSGLWRPYTKDEFNKKKKRSCGSCLYRRLTEGGYTCMAGHEPSGV